MERLKHHPSRKGLTRQGRLTGAVRFHGQCLDQLLHWKKPRRIFICAHSDLFHEQVPEAWIDRVLAVMALCPRHTLQVLTKRPERAWGYLDRFVGPHCGEAVEQVALAAVTITGDPAVAESVSGMNTPLDNVWLGSSVEDQRTADERIWELLDAPAVIRWISAELLLGPIDLRDVEPPLATPGAGFPPLDWEAAGASPARAPPDAPGLGALAARPVRGHWRAVLLQANGWPPPEGRRPPDGRPDLGPDARAGGATVTDTLTPWIDPAFLWPRESDRRNVRAARLR